MKKKEIGKTSGCSIGLLNYLLYNMHKLPLLIAVIICGIYLAIISGIFTLKLLMNILEKTWQVVI